MVDNSPPSVVKSPLQLMSLPLHRQDEPKCRSRFFSEVCGQRNQGLYYALNNQRTNFHVQFVFLVSEMENF
jgi:hypothetical protein